MHRVFGYMSYCRFTSFVNGCWDAMLTAAVAAAAIAAAAAAAARSSFLTTHQMMRPRTAPGAGCWNMASQYSSSNRRLTPQQQQQQPTKNTNSSNAHLQSPAGNAMRST
jgi:hypothetical protein